MIGLIHEPALMAAHDKVGHAEHAGRLALAALDSLSLENFAPNVELRGATDAELLAVHTPSHLQAVADQRPPLAIPRVVGDLHDVGHILGRDDQVHSAASLGITLPAFRIQLGSNTRLSGVYSVG